MHRKSNHENPVFSFEQIEDVLDLICNNELPDTNFTDEECSLFEIICDKLDSIETFRSDATKSFKTGDLYPCPFCGESVKVIECQIGDSFQPLYRIDHCNNENCGMDFCLYETREEVVQAWNTRI